MDFHNTFYSILALSAFTLLLNLPFGYARSKTKRYLLRWFLYIHIPIPFIFIARTISPVSIKYIPIFIIAAEVRKGVRGFKEGYPIMAVHTAPSLKCMFCKKGLYNLCEKIMHTKVLGAFAEYILLPSHVVKQNVFHKQKNLSFEEAAFLEPLSCVVHSIEPLDIKKGDSAQ